MSLVQYDMWWSPTWPEVLFTGKGQARATGRALPDRLVLADGQLYAIEIKTWCAKSKHTLRKRLHQYYAMERMGRYGAVCFYLVLWRWRATEEWRLYPVDTLRVENGGVVFTREDGIEVHENVPDWLGALRRKEAA